MPLLTSWWVFTNSFVVPHTIQHEAPVNYWMNLFVFFAGTSSRSWWHYHRWRQLRIQGFNCEYINNRKPKIKEKRWAGFYFSIFFGFVFQPECQVKLLMIGQILLWYHNVNNNQNGYHNLSSLWYIKYFLSTIWKQRRCKDLESKGLLFVGSGVSGGEDGARYGPSLMPGGSDKAWYVSVDCIWWFL